MAVASFTIKEVNEFACRVKNDRWLECRFITILSTLFHFASEVFVQKKSCCFLNGSMKVCIFFPAVTKIIGHYQMAKGIKEARELKWNQLSVVLNIQVLHVALMGFIFCV